MGFGLLQMRWEVIKFGVVSCGTGRVACLACMNACRSTGLQGQNGARTDLAWAAGVWTLTYGAIDLECDGSVRKKQAAVA